MPAMGKESPSWQDWHGDEHGQHDCQRILGRRKQGQNRFSFPSKYYSLDIHDKAGTGIGDGRSPSKLVVGEKAFSIGKVLELLGLLAAVT